MPLIIVLDKGGVVWNVLKERIGVVGVVHLAAVVLQTVADYQIFHTHYDVVAAYLVEHLLGDVDVRCLVFYDHARMKMLVVKHGVTPLRQPVESKLHLVAH